MFILRKSLIYWSKSFPPPLTVEDEGGQGEQMLGVKWDRLLNIWMKRPWWSRPISSALACTSPLIGWLLEEEDVGTAMMSALVWKPAVAKSAVWLLIRFVFMLPPVEAHTEERQGLRDKSQTIPYYQVSGQIVCNSKPAGANVSLRANRASEINGTLRVFSVSVLRLICQSHHRINVNTCIYFNHCIIFTDKSWVLFELNLQVEDLLACSICQSQQHHVKVEIIWY